MENFDDPKRIKRILNNISPLERAIIFVENVESLAKNNLNGLKMKMMNKRNY